MLRKIEIEPEDSKGVHAHDVPRSPVNVRQIRA
jgi:hypothetical protein